MEITLSKENIEGVCEIIKAFAMRANIRNVVTVYNESKYSMVNRFLHTINICECDKDVIRFKFAKQNYGSHIKIGAVIEFFDNYFTVKKKDTWTSDHYPDMVEYYYGDNPPPVNIPLEKMEEDTFPTERHWAIEWFRILKNLAPQNLK